MNSKSKPIQVLVVEDEPMIRDAVCIHLNQDVRTSVFGSVDSVDEAMGMLEVARPRHSNSESSQLSQFPDVILVDIQFRTKDGKQEAKGPELIRKIDQMRKSVGDMDVKLLCLSRDLDPKIITDALEAGANGYLDKHQVVAGWVEAIEWVHQGFTVFSPGVLRQVALFKRFTNLGEIRLVEPKTDFEITEKAREIAFMYWRSGMTAKEVAEAKDITEATVRYHLKNVLKSEYMIVAFGGPLSRKS